MVPVARVYLGSLCHFSQRPKNVRYACILRFIDRLQRFVCCIDTPPADRKPAIGGLGVAQASARWSRCLCGRRVAVEKVRHILAVITAAVSVFVALLLAHPDFGLTHQPAQVMDGHTLLVP